MNSNPHCDSLPLFFLIEKYNDKPVKEAFEAMQRGIKELKLEDHLECEVFDDKVVITHKTTYGELILSELAERSLEDKCEKKCEYSVLGTCKHCGHPSVN